MNLHDETVRRREFPVCAEKIFLAHAGVSPLPRRVARAMQDYLEAASRDDQEEALPEALVTRTRQLAADFLGVERDEIAFTGSTSMGLALVAEGLDWRVGDNLVCYRDDYPANVYPWMNLARRGVTVRFVQPRQYGRVTVDDLEPVVDARTRLVALSSVHYLSGWRLDIASVGRYLHQRGVLFCLDGIQSFGALRTPLDQVDFAAADAHKWLLGPLGIALLFVRRQHWDRLRPVLVGWRSASCPNYIAQDELAFWPGARRYEPGSLNLVGITGLGAALNLLRDRGLETVEQRVLKLASLIRQLGTARGWPLVGPATEEDLSGIVTFGRGDWEERPPRAVISVRRSRQGGQCIRFAPHFYNTESEIAAALDVDLGSDPTGRPG
jgi:selenocysteine lyase/cysteine desulfurase